MAAAHAAFPAWSKTGPGERRALLNKAADVLASKVGEFTELLIAETGGTGPWTGFNVMLAAGMLREAAGMTTQIHSRSEGTAAEDLEAVLSRSLGDEFLPARGDQLLAAVVRHQVPGHVLWQLADLPTNRVYLTYAEVARVCGTGAPPSECPRWYA